MRMTKRTGTRMRNLRSRRRIGMESTVPQFSRFEKQWDGDYIAQDERFEYEINFNKFTDEWSAAAYDKETYECVYETWDANFTPQDAWHEMYIGFVPSRVGFVAESSSEYDSMILSYVYEGDALSRFTSYIVVVGTTDFEEAKRAVESCMKGSVGFMYVENNNYRLINYHEWREKYPWSNYEQITMSGERIAKTASIRSADANSWYVYFDTKPGSGGELRMSLNNDDLGFYKNYDNVEVPSDFGVGWGDSIDFDPIEFGYDNPSILELADGWEILDLVDTILIERRHSAGYEKSAGSNPEDYITKDDLTDVFDDDDVLYYVGRSPEGREIGIEIDWNTHDLEYVCTIDGMPYTSVGVYDFMDEDGKYFDEAVKALSVCVFELEHGVKFPRDYWGKPIIGKHQACYE